MCRSLCVSTPPTTRRVTASWPSSMCALQVRSTEEWLRRTGCLDRTVKRQNVRPFLGHMHRRGKTPPRGVPGRPTGPRKDTASGRSEWGSSHPGHLTAAAPIGPSLRGSGRPGTSGEGILTIALEGRTRATTTWKALPGDGRQSMDGGTDESLPAQEAVGPNRTAREKQGPCSSYCRTRVNQDVSAFTWMLS